MKPLRLLLPSALLAGCIIFSGCEIDKNQRIATEEVAPDESEVAESDIIIEETRRRRGIIDRIRDFFNPPEPEPEPENCDHYSSTKSPFFGDLHVHTSRSFDAGGGFGSTENGPDMAYRFAKGEPIELAPYDEQGNGRTYQLDRPLDFAAATDHAEFFAEVDICTDPGNRAYNSTSCIAWRQEGPFVEVMEDTPLEIIRDLVVFGIQLLLPDPIGTALCSLRPFLCADSEEKVWQEMQDVAQAHNDESNGCKFTTFVGYEWTGLTGGNNLHRNVIFKNNEVPDRPISYVDESKPERLWDRLDSECNHAGTGCEVIAIPHNSNISGGLMFVPQLTSGVMGLPTGDVYTADKARQRSRVEPIVEMFQHKGASECLNIEGLSHPLASEDELCDFEQIALPVCTGKPDDPADCIKQCDQTITGNPFGAMASLCVGPGGFIRPALTAGLQFQENYGANPFQFGFIASTDTHNATPGGTGEYDWQGHVGEGDATAEARLYPLLDPNAEPGNGPLEMLTRFAGPNVMKYFSPGGLAVVWAEENSRDSIFNGMKNRETYATSGTRITVRFFGGYGYHNNMCGSHNMVAAGYNGGVAMGGTIERSGNTAPKFIVSAQQDTGTTQNPGAPLERIQIIKGWIENGERKEEVFDVAGSSSLGATVDLDTGELSGEGYPDLCETWTDPEFNPDETAFYYARVLEVPTLRWSRHECNRYVEAGGDIDCTEVNAVLPPTQQERAWTSPIWFNP